MSRRIATAALACAWLPASACTGLVGKGGGGEPGGPGGPSGPSEPTPAELTVGATGLHRLSRIEYDNTVADLLGDRTRAGFGKLPEDVHDPFDNDFATQIPSGALVGAAETLAAEAAARLLADPARRDALVGCRPAGPGDAACLETFVRTFGRRAFRRPLGDDEVVAFAALRSFAVEAGDFYVGVELVLRAMLQDPSFLYRVERGQPVPGRAGLHALGDYEIGTRLSYFLWGSTPSDALLDMAAAGALGTAVGRREAAEMLIADARGRDRAAEFHRFWLGYHQLPLAPSLASAMRAESDALVVRVVFEEKSDYFQLFRADQTFVDATLAQHYGLPAPASGASGGAAAWVGYGSSPRRGILSHGAVLAAGAKFDDTSPTLRGVFVRNRLLCQVVMPPPPNAAVDEPPAATTSRCKVDRYAAHGSGGCAGCHSLTDPIGFGLEAYDRTGAFRATDKDAPECAISGDGEVAGLGRFNGPAELGELVASSGALEVCVVTQLFRMALGRRESAADAATLGALSDGFARGGRRMETLLADVVAHPAFVHRQVEP